MNTCSSCAVEVPEASRFCGNCGASLAQPCLSCGKENPPENNFCSQCGTPLAEAAAPTRAPTGDSGERRFVTALFADLVGFTALSEERDPEEIRSLLTTYFERCQAVIERFGGVVDKFTGDAITAFWGAKRALEDDAERAVRAALELVDTVAVLGGELGIPGLTLRVGVLSGETSVGSGGNEHGLVVGDIVNTAARLQSTADPGSVFVGPTTQQLTSSSIRYEAAGAHEMKGKSEPVEAWRAVAVIGQRGGTGKWEVLEPPFVGREDELRLLKDQLHATTREGAARLISIVGEAGIGKSRLAWELLKYADGITETIRWHQGRSPAYGEAVTFWALTEMVRSRAGIAETDEPLKARTRLRTTVAEYGPEEDEQQWIEARLAGLLGLADMPSGNRDELYAALRRFFQRVAETATTVLLFEDLHWADDGQLEFIEELVEMSPRHPIMVVTLARPELLERHPRWGSARHHFMSAHLGPLTDAEMTELVTGLVPGVSEQTTELLIGRAGGVPLYAVEYVRTLINTGDLVLDGSTYRQTRELADVALPDSLHAVIGSRLDRLSDLHRSLVQDAAVLGQSFTIEGLTVFTDKSRDELEPELRDLARQELLRYDSDPRSPERGQYQFVQGVIREVAYGRIALAERRERHVHVAEYFEAAAPVEAAAVIASHYMAAYQASPGDELADRARKALTSAARRAGELKSFTQALALIEQALEVPGTDADRAELWSLAVPHANALFHHEEAITFARQAHEWYAEHGTPAEAAAAAHVLGTAVLSADRPSDAIEAMAPWWDAERADEPEMQRLGAVLANSHLRADSNQEGADIALSVMIAAEASGNLALLIDAMNTRGSTLPQLGRSAEAGALLREALRLAEQENLPWDTLRAINNLSVVEAANGQAPLFSSYERGYELAQRLREGSLLVRLTSGYANALFLRGRVPEARDVLAGIDTGEESDWTSVLRGIDAFFSWTLTGDPADLDRHIDEIRVGLDSAEPQYRAHATSALSGAFALAGDLPGSFELAEQVELPQANQDHWYTAAKAAILLGDPQRLRRLPTMYQAFHGRRFDVVDAMVATGLEVTEGDATRAAAMFTELIERIEAVEGPQPASEWRLVFAEVIPEQPEANAAAEEAYRWFSERGLNGFLRLGAPVWKRHLDSTSEAG
jgi:class 3 adenylate cyclase/tetratricopeptide (TPR) repeat protein